MLDLSDEYDRYGREQRKLDRKQHGSNNWERQRQKVATAKRQIKRKVLDYLDSARESRPSRERRVFRRSVGTKERTGRE